MTEVAECLWATVSERLNLINPIQATGGKPEGAQCGDRDARGGNLAARGMYAKTLVCAAAKERRWQNTLKNSLVCQQCAITYIVPFFYYNSYQTEDLKDLIFIFA